ncbi:MAG: acyltransferase [Legionellaceae bacterium]|nr:acyltransferase [Legionellaceae bacterium]
MTKVSPDNGGQVWAILCLLILIVSTLLCFMPILCIGLLKLIPHKGWQTQCTRMVDAIASFWTGINNFFIQHTQNIDWQISGLSHLRRDTWYLITANHQSWLDIVILQKIFNRKIPVLKFFIKDQLKWVPLLGFAWWAMGCPFMKRYSREQLAKNPHKRHKDLQATHKSVERFKRAPTTIINFVEGTRFSPIKHAKQQSPYQNLLKPKAGGISYVLTTMGQQIDSILDVTIIYPEHKNSLWDFLCRRIHAVHIKIRRIPIPPRFLQADLLAAETEQKAFREWLNQQWLEKDQLIARMKQLTS